MNKERFYIDTEGNDDEAYKESMKYAFELANNDSEIKKVILLLNGIGNSGPFERIYGRDIEKQLHKGMKFQDCDAVFKFETKRTYKESYKASDVVICCGLDSEDVFKIDDLHCAKAIIAIPWLRSRLQPWVSAWSPTELRGNQGAVQSLSEPSCIVRKAMEDLTNQINRTTGINHPNDEHLAKTYVLALHKYEQSLDAQVVNSFLIKELGWQTSHAKEVVKMVETLNAGKSFKGGHRKGLQHVYKRFKNECEKNSNLKR